MVCGSAADDGDSKFDEVVNDTDNEDSTFSSAFTSYSIFSVDDRGGLPMRAFTTMLASPFAVFVVSEPIATHEPP